VAVFRRVAGVLAGVLVLAAAGCADPSATASASCASVVDLGGVR
jgi:hypothetical protein